MKKKFSLFAANVLLAAGVLMGLNAHAQSVVFKPNSAVGEDVDIVTSYGCTPNIFPSPVEFLNWDGYDLNYGSWTIYALGCSNTDGQALIRFTEMNDLPCNAVITKATLYLYGVPTSGFVPQGNSYYPGSPFPPNPGWVERVTSGWAESSVTWSTMPSTTSVNQTPIPSTSMQWNDNFVIDVTALTQDIWTSGSNDGYMLRLQTASPYRSAVFASSDDPNPALWPELHIDYYVPHCNANFTYCSSTQYPNTYNFTATDPSFCNYKWDFGDGSSGIGSSATHTYSTPGSYKVCLTILDSKGKVMCRECTQICITKIVAPPKDEAPAAKDDSPLMHKLTSNNTGAVAAAKPAHGASSYMVDGPLTITNVNPNPAHSNLDVNIRLVKAGKVQYKIFDMEGKEVLSDSRLLNDGAQKLSISVKQLPAGVYILEMKDDFAKVGTKFTKE